MNINNIMSKIDNTLLKPTATREEIFKLCDDSLKYKMATVCIPMCYVSDVKKYLGEKLPVCTVIGFPLGYSTTEVKVFETKKAIEDGADEVDMVINIGKLKEKDFSYVENEIKQIKEVVGDKVLKVIIETCFLTDEEKIIMCNIVTNSGADFIKTSTGFGTNGATLDDIKLFSENVGSNVRIKAAGGIRTLDDAIKFIEQGASRLGTSAGVKIYEAFISGNNNLNHNEY